MTIGKTRVCNVHGVASVSPDCAIRVDKRLVNRPDLSGFPNFPSYLLAVDLAQISLEMSRVERRTDNYILFGIIRHERCWRISYE
jgi:hypothetical protein